ncbi:MAG: L-serine ammonia-lyase, iron-sulfur-dependent, subunit alpha [Candidatus Sumerlaeota bacterium]|nr:L-serine ammonia-lyase, iron-sulfur-dependent, subunit alpha [Candidatus Sumerlaeota bacterium]
MKTISILNQVLGPVMRGPSSSHTAGAFHIGCMARSLLGGAPRKAVLAFDPAGSYAATYVQQGADRGFAMGLMKKPLTDESFFTALSDAPKSGLEICFQVRKLANPDHPNTVEIDLTATDGRELHLAARSIGGGEVEITRVDGRPVLFNGSAYETLVEVPAAHAPAVQALLAQDGALLEKPVRSIDGGTARLTTRRKAALPSKIRCGLLALGASARIWESTPVYFVQTGQPLFASAAQMVQLAQERNQSLGKIALAYEAQLLGISEAEVMNEALRRYDIMAQSVERGLDPEFTGLQLLPPCAGAIFQAEAAGRLSARSLHTRAAARAMAVMHVDGAMGVVCAAPTGGSAGVIPGTLLTVAEERSLTREQIALALLAAGAIGVILAQRATFAAEVAGCQVEIGASGAMASAAVVDASGGSARQACDAAAISFQNTMGMVCDLLHGMVEIPCHTRNAVAAASAFVNADMILGGYANLIPLDETIDAVYAVGQAMPVELRCTSKGGLAIAPSAQALKPRKPIP